MHEVVRQHLETFLAEARRRSGGNGLPRFVERGLREFLSCGVMARGFARFRCSGCKREILVAFSCKGRFCPSCCGRRMGELAAHLVDGVFGDVPTRQWVLTLPHRLRFKLAYDHHLCRAVLAVFTRALLAFERRRARAQGITGRGGAVTAIQRCGSALNTNIHFHTLVAEGVFEGGFGISHTFVAAPAPPTDSEVARLLAAVRRRIVRLVRRHGIDLDAAFDDETTDPLLLDSPALAALQGASVVGRVATGPRAGQRVLRLGSAPNAPVVSSGGPRHAHLKGFDLHANVAVRAGDRVRLEHLCRYVLRPPVAQGALELTPDGKVLLRLRHPWRDGTRAIRFEPSELLEKLAALIPRPRANMLIYHGAFAPRGSYHESAAIERHCAAEAMAPVPSSPAASAAEVPPVSGAPCRAEVTAVSSAVGSASIAAADDAVYTRPRHFAWADLLRRIFLVDILACPDCGGRLHLVATIQEPALVQKLLLHLGLPVAVPSASPARSPPWLPGFGDTGGDE